MGGPSGLSRGKISPLFFSQNLVQVGSLGEEDVNRDLA